MLVLSRPAETALDRPWGRERFAKGKNESGYYSVLGDMYSWFMQAVGDSRGCNTTSQHALKKNLELKPVIVRSFSGRSSQLNVFSRVERNRDLD